MIEGADCVACTELVFFSLFFFPSTISFSVFYIRANMMSLNVIYDYLFKKSEIRLWQDGPSKPW